MNSCADAKTITWASFVAMANIVTHHPVGMVAAALRALPPSCVTAPVNSQVEYCLLRCFRITSLLNYFFVSVKKSKKL